MFGTRPGLRGSRKLAEEGSGFEESRYFATECEELNCKRTSTRECRASKKRASTRLARHFNGRRAEEDDIDSNSVPDEEDEECVSEETESKYFGQLSLNLSEGPTSDSEDCGKLVAECHSTRKRKLKRSNRSRVAKKKKLKSQLVPKVKEVLQTDVQKVFEDNEPKARQKEGALCEKDSVARGEPMGLERSEDVLAIRQNVREEGLSDDLSDQVQSVEKSVIKEVESVCVSDSDVDWEEVDAPKPLEICPKAATNHDIEITIQSQGKQCRLTSCLQRAVAKYSREVQVSKHQVHLLCLLAVLQQRSKICNSQLLQACCMSLVPESFLKIRLKKFELKLLTDLINWFVSSFTHCPSPADTSIGELIPLLEGIAAHEVCSALQFAMVLVALCRVLKFRCRLMASMQPLPLKWSAAKSNKEKTGNGGGKGRCPKKLARTKQKRQSKRQIAYCETKSDEGEMDTEETYSENEVNKMEGVNKKCEKNFPGKDRSKTSKAKQKGLASKAAVVSKTAGKKRKTRFDDADSDFEMVTLPEKETDSDKSDCMGKTSRRERCGQQRTQKKKPGHMIKSNFGQSDKSISTAVDGMTDSWVEVFLPSVDKWICINPMTGVVDSVEDIIAHATQPMSYVVSIENDGTLKDVSTRYVSDWMTGARRRRVDNNWWKETLRPFKTNRKKDDQKEDSLIQASLEKLPFPLSIGDYKNHPLYALKRHLLKFEGIYPEMEPLGFFKGEAIYPRECIRTLHSRETWLKYARMVKAGEQPFKMVKQRPKRNEPQHLRDQLRLEVFGEWQTEVYKPDPVKDGKVPRNAYGNIELFQPSMLPPGAVHIQIPNIQKIARKLDIDHAPAMVGWDFHGGFSHPLLDGIVVAKEFEQTLLDAWEEQQEELERKAVQKREKVIMDRWRKVIKGLLICDRLRRKYDFQDDNGNEFADNENGSGIDKVSTAVSKHQSCSEEKDVVGHLTLPPVVH